MTFYSIRWNKLSAGLRPTLIPDRDGGEHNAEQRYVEMKLPTAGDAFGDVAGLIEVALREDNELVAQRNAMVKPMAEEVKEMYRKEGRLRFRVPRDIVEVARDAAESLSNEVSDRKAETSGKTRFSIGDWTSFARRQAKAEADRGTVAAGLNEGVVQVTKVTPHVFDGGEPITQAKKWAKENLSGTYDLINEDGNKVKYTISNNNIKKYLSGLEGEELAGRGVDLEVHLSALMVLPEIIEQSIPAEVHADYEKVDGERGVENNVNKEVLIHRYYGAIVFSNKLYRVKTTLKEYSDKNRENKAYNYELTRIEVITDNSITTSIGAQESVSDDKQSLGGAKLLKGVEKSYDPGKFLLDESAKKTAMDEAKANETRFRIRTAPDPLKTIQVYKLFDVDEEGKPHALFIDAANALEYGEDAVFYDADSPQMKDLEGLEVNYSYLLDGEGNVVRRRPTHVERKPKPDGKGNTVTFKGLPGKVAVKRASEQGERWMSVTLDAYGERQYHTIGINGSDGVTPYALRPGWHATDYPSAPHIGTTGGEGGNKPRYRKANQRWFLCEIAADVDYNPEVRERYAKLHPKDKEVYEKLKGDMPERIPENGFYNFRTNSNANPNQSWYIAGAIRILKPITEKEVKRINAEGGVPEDLSYKDGYKTFVEEDTDGPDDPDGPESGGRAKKKGTKKKKSVPAVPRDIFEVARESAQRIANRGAGGTSFRVDESPEARQMADGRQITGTESEPTDAQKEAGNYRKKHVRVDGHAISIENEAGSVRCGRDADGKEWATEMKFDYGYIRGTEGVDGDHIDVFLSGTPERGDVYVVDQVNKDGSFDEHKVMYGFGSEEEARAAYLSNYEEGWQGLGAITRVSREDFKKWVRSSKRKTKPFAEYKGVKTGGTQFRENTKNPTWNATTYALSNLLSRAKTPVLDVTSKSDVAKLQKISEDIKKKIAEMPKKGYGVNGIRHIINEAIKANVKSPDSSYKDLEINGHPTVIRVSNHSAKVLNFNEENINIGIVVKTSNADFKSQKDVDYIEFMYYGDHVANNPGLQSEILSGLRQYIETSSFEEMPMPNRLCASGEYKTILQRLGLKPTNKGVVDVDKLGLRGETGSIGLTTFRVTEDAGGSRLGTVTETAPESAATDGSASVAREAVGTHRGARTQFRITGVPAVAAAAVYESRVRTAGYQVQEAFQDSMLGLRAAYEAIENGSRFSSKPRKIEDIPDAQNAYLFENRMSSLNQEEQRLRINNLLMRTEY